MLVGRHDPGRHGGSFGTDAAVAARVERGVERQSQPATTGGDLGPCGGIVLADAGGEDDAVDAALSSRGVEARCGLLVVDTRSGDIVEWLRLEGVVKELFDVAVLAGVRNPSAIGFRTDEILRTISMDDTALG